MVKSISDIDEFKALIAEDKAVIVDFTATWCGPCKLIAPYFEKEAAGNDDMTFIKVDVDEGEAIADYCDIQAMPTFVTYRDGQKVEFVVEPKPAELKELVNRLSSM